MKINYQRELDKTIENLGDNRPKLLLHSCCAPCSSYVLEYLSRFFKITILFYNPNIYPEGEFYRRLSEQNKLIEKMGLDILVNDVGYLDKEFYEISKGLENEPEGGARCENCFKLRLDKTAKMAHDMGFDFFTTTLTISPLKNEQLINELGKELSDKYGVSYLYSDFKKKNGYKRSVELSKIYNLYRQNYCGCIYSILQKENR